MDTRVFSVYNEARGACLSSKVTVADCANQPLKILKVMVSGLALDAESGIWLTPLQATPVVPRLFPFDVVYLDKDHLVLDSCQIVPGVEFPQYHTGVASALVLPLNAVQSTHTRCGDRLTICLAKEIEQPVAADRGQAGPAQETLQTSVNHLQEGPAAGAPPVAVAERQGGSAQGSVQEERTPHQPSSEGNGHGSPKVAVKAEAAVSRENKQTGDHDVRGDSKTRGFAEAMSRMANVAADYHPTGSVQEPGVTAGEPEKAIEARSDNNHEAKSAAPGKPSAVSITEALLERPRIVQTPATPEHHGGVEDLFSNWVSSPLATPSWISRGQRNDEAREESGSAGQPTGGPSQPDAPPKAETKAPIAPARENRESTPPVAIPPAASTVASSTQAAIRGPQQATTYTAAHPGMWRVSMPTAIGPMKPAGKTEADSKQAAKQPDAEKGKADSVSKVAEPDPPVVSAPASVPVVEEKAAPTHKDDAAKPAVATRKTQSERRKEIERLASVSRSDFAEPQAATEKRGSDWRTDKIVESTGRPVPASFAAAVEQKLERLQSKPSVSAGNELEKMSEGEPAATNVAAPESTKSPAAPPAPAPKAPVATKQTGVPSQDELSMTLPLPRFLKPEQKGKLKISIRRVDPSRSDTEKSGGLGARFKRWLSPAVPTSRERRRAHRRYVPGMVAHYYTGGAPKPYDVADISMTGFYLLTEDRWMPDTMIQMTLQKPCAKGERKQSITVLSRIVRRGSDGVAAEFVMPESLDSTSRDVQPNQATDRFALARFL